LRDEIVQVFDLTNLDGLTNFLLERLKGGGLGPGSTGGDFVRHTLLMHRLLKKRKAAFLS
jgi:hypothetical protein